MRYMMFIKHTEDYRQADVPASLYEDMGKFIVGLIIGVLIGVAVVSYNPGLADRMQAVVEDTTGIVLRGTEEAAESVGDAARDAADEAGDAANEAGEAVEGAGERPATDPQ